MKYEIKTLDELNHMSQKELEELILNAAGSEEGASILCSSGKVAFSFASFQEFDAEKYIGSSYDPAGRISIAIINLLIDGKIENNERKAGSGKLTYVATSVVAH